MGAQTFEDLAKGETVKKAFRSAIEEAQYESGHGGYTGTIAEKDRYVMVVSCATVKEAQELASKMIEDGDERIDDKWGPAGCIAILEAPGTWLFFGWASS